MKKIICMFICVVCLATSVSCGNSISQKDLDELCSWYWESYVDVMRFTEDGRILRNFQFLHESDSRYTVTDKEMTMYLEGFPEDAMTFQYRLEDDKLYIGDVEYKKYKEVTEEEKKAAKEYEKTVLTQNKESAESFGS